MKSKLVCAALVLGLVGTAATAAESSWRKVAPAGGKFQVLMPSEPLHQKQTERTPFGTMDVNLYMGMDLDKNIAYLVGTCDLPPAVRDQAKPSEQALDTMVQGAVIGAKGKLLGQKKITLAGHSGREFEASVLNGAGTLKGRAFLVKGRIYLVMVLSPKGREDAANSARFFDSFKFAAAAAPLDLLRD